MLRRFAALLFVLTIAGNVWAGICDCFDGGNHPVSKCCKRERSDKDSVSQKPCCESDCGQPGFNTVHRTQTDSGVRVPMPTDVVSIEPLLPEAINYRMVGDAGVRRSLFEIRQQFPRPPNLYIKHHSFLI